MQMIISLIEPYDSVTNRCSFLQVDGATGVHHTYGDIVSLVPRLAWGLGQAGVAKGAAVVVMMPNHIGNASIRVGAEFRFWSMVKYWVG